MKLRQIIGIINCRSNLCHYTGSIVKKISMWHGSHFLRYALYYGAVPGHIPCPILVNLFKKHILLHRFPVQIELPPVFLGKNLFQPAPILKTDRFPPVSARAAGTYIDAIHLSAAQPASAHTISISVNDIFCILCTNIHRSFRCISHSSRNLLYTKKQICSIKNAARRIIHIVKKFISCILKTGKRSISDKGVPYVPRAVNRIQG